MCAAQCVTAAVAWTLAVICQLVIPTIPFAISLVMYGLARLWSVYVKKPTYFGFHLS
jgi:hypothetical protein